MLGSVEAARTAGAPDYAKEDFTKLDQELALAKDELALTTPIHAAVWIQKFTAATSFHDHRSVF
jgi:hypothetical protein